MRQAAIRPRWAADRIVRAEIDLAATARAEVEMQQAAEARCRLGLRLSFLVSGSQSMRRQWKSQKKIPSRSKTASSIRFQVYRPLERCARMVRHAGLIFRL